MKQPINKLKTTPFSRRLSIAKTSLTIGKNIAKHNLASLFGQAKANSQQQIISEQMQYLVHELGQLKGSVVKVGQMLALYGEGILPNDVIHALHTLDDNTAPLEFNTIYQAIYAEIGELIHDFDIAPTPIGTASLAQVHKATHKHTKQTVALKVQYPGVAEAIDSDLSFFKHLLKITNVVPQTKLLDDWFYEIQTLLKHEVDYTLEADTTERFFARLNNDPRYIVPRIYRNYCTPRLLCMSFEEGISLNDPQLKNLSQDRRNRLGQNALEIVMHELFTWQEMQTDPNFGNYLVRLNDKCDQLILLDFGAIKAFDGHLINIAKKLLTAGFYQDHAQMINAMTGYDFFDKMNDKIKSDMADVFLIATEAFASPKYLNNQQYLDNHGRYLWANSNLYNRSANHAKQCMQSREFSMPPKELLFISRKFIGAYALLSAINAHTCAEALSKTFLDH